MREGELQSFDETKLFFLENEIIEAKACVLIVHGVSEHSGRYLHVMEFLEKHGYASIAFDLRGNGRSGGKKGTVSSFKVLIEDIYCMVQYAKQRYKTIFLLGHSMGGFLVNTYATMYDDVNGIVSSGAVAVFLKQVSPFRLIPFQPIRWLKIKNKLSNQLSHDEEVGKLYQKDPYVNQMNRVGLFGEVFVKGVRYLRKNVQKIHTPILYLHGRDDAIIPLVSTEFLFKNSSSVQKKIVIYDNMYHEILNEIEKEKVLDEIVGWLETCQ